MDKKAFTLAEIMIVLAVIGILSAILIPIARNSIPNENVMKFKKAHNALYTVIRELVNSSEYYLDGDLGIKPDGNLIDGTHSGDNEYFCNTFAEILTVKEKNCSSVDTGVAHFALEWETNGTLGGEKIINYIDRACKKYASNIGNEIVISNGTSYYQTGPTYPFGYTSELIGGQRYNTLKKDGFIQTYKIFCIDIDGIHSSATSDNCINECPFGYGIRTDGKILNGARAQEWLNKSIQDKE